MYFFFMKVDYHYVLWYKLFLFIFCFYYRMFCLFAFTIDLSVNFCISVSHFLPFGINIFSSCFGITFSISFLPILVSWYHIFCLLISTFPSICYFCITHSVYFLSAGISFHVRLSFLYFDIIFSVYL